MSDRTTAQIVAAVREGADVGAFELGAIDWDVVVAELGNGPYTADLFVAICNVAGDRLETPDLLARLLSDLTDVAATQECVQALCAMPPPRAAIRQCFASLQGLVSDRNRHYGVRAAALRGALYLAQSDPPSLRRLEGDLLAIDIADEPNFLRHVAAVLGLLASRRPDTDMLDVLRSLASVSVAADEAALALGFVDLAAALGEGDRVRAIARFSAASRWFSVASATKDRAEARLLSGVLEVVLGFAEGRKPSELQKSLSTLREALFEYVAKTTVRDGRPSDLSWIGLRTVEAAHWGALGVAVCRLADNLDRAGWLHPIVVIENELFMLLSASRTLFRHDDQGGFEAAISPRIETSFAADRARLSILEQWLGEKRSGAWAAEAARLHRGVRDRLEAVAGRNPSEAAGVTSTLAAIDSAEGVNAAERTEIRQLIAAAGRMLTSASVDPIIDEILEVMLGKLRRNADFVRYSRCAALFAEILLVTLRFVCATDGVQRDISNDYLFDLDRLGPHEKELQRHYMSAIRLTSLARLAIKEPQDVGGGRADVQFSFEGHTVVTECKRTIIDEGNAGAASRYGTQASAYQSSSVTFAALLVLDLVNRGGGAEHIRNRASIEFVSRNGTEYALAVFRVQGRRKGPSRQKS